MPKRAVLLLNASEEVLSVIDWKKAFNLLYNGKARAAHGHDHHYDIQSTTGTFRLPSAIVLVQYTYIPFRTAGKCTRKNVLRRDNYECQYCGVKLPTLSKIKTTIDHVVPRSRGGDSGWTNLVASCQKCNLHKANKTPKRHSFTGCVFSLTTGCGFSSTTGCVFSSTTGCGSSSTVANLLSF